MQVIIPASSAGSSFAADVYLADAVSLKTSSNPIAAGSGRHVGSEVTWPDHHADFPQGVVVRVFPGVPNNPIRAQWPPSFQGVAASLHGKKEVMTCDETTMTGRAVGGRSPCSKSRWGWRRSTGCTTNRCGRFQHRCFRCQGCWSSARHGTSWKSPELFHWSLTHAGGTGAPRPPRYKHTNTSPYHGRNKQQQLSAVSAATWISGRGHVYACCSSPPGGSGGCTLLGRSARVCVRCPTRTPSAGRQNHPGSPSSSGQSSPTRRHAAGSQSSRHLGYRRSFTPSENGPIWGMQHDLSWSN